MLEPSTHSLLWNKKTIYKRQNPKTPVTISLLNITERIMVTRRDFLKTMTLASAGLAVGSGEILNAHNLSSLKDRKEKVKIAYVGIGNRGQQIIEDFARTDMVEVVALCDVDMGAKHTQKVISMYPKAKQFRDFRQMFDKAGKDFDAVAIATPDHSHFPISMLALASGKHVYVE